MKARRQRLLDAVKEMIAESGVEGFTIRELSQRAKVSITTIYATCGDKENLIAAAIVDYYHQLPVASAPAAVTLSEALANADRARGAIIANKAYARQYTELFFSSTADPKVYAAILDTVSASGGLLQWLERARARGDILDGLTPDVLRTMLANTRLSIMHDWAQGRLSDADLAVWGWRSFLLFARSVTQGETLAEVEAELKRRLAQLPTS